MIILEIIFSLRVPVNHPIRVTETETALIRREAIIVMILHRSVATETENVAILVAMKKITTKIKMKPMKVKTMVDFLNLLKIQSKKLCPEEKL